MDPKNQPGIREEMTGSLKHHSQTPRQKLSDLRLPLLVGVAFVPLLLAGPVKPAQVTTNESDPIPLLAYYYIWFDPGSWSRAKSDLPLLGEYSSNDENVIRQHVKWARQAGIDGFIVSWKATDRLNERLDKLIRVSEQENFKLAIIYQGLDFERRPLPIDQISADLAFFIREFSENTVFDLFPQPLVIWSGTWEFSGDEISAVTGVYRDRLSILASERQVESYEAIADHVDGNAYYWSSVDPETFPNYQEKLNSMSQAVHARNGYWIAPAAPGFDARLIEGTRVIQRKNGETLIMEINAAYESAPDIVGIISWNEFSENTHIEPSKNYGTRSLEVIAEIRGGVVPIVPDFESSEPAGIEIEANPGRIAAVLLMVALALVSIAVLVRRASIAE
jgi:hypothetical protein